MRRYHNDLRQRVVDLCRDGMSRARIVDTLRISRATVQRILKTYNDYQSFDNPFVGLPGQNKYVNMGHLEVFYGHSALNNTVF
jgi:transposase